MNTIAIKNFERYFNYTPAVGDVFFNHLPIEYAAIFKPLYDRALEGLNSTSVSQHHEQGDTFSLEVSCSPIITNNETTGATFFARSVTKRVEAEKRLKAAKKIAEEASIFKSKFLANMSHEIRTPMNAMLGFSDLLAKTQLNEEQKEYVEIIQYSGEDLLVIVNDILDISKIQAGKMELRTESINLMETLRQINNLHQKKVTTRGNKLNFNYIETLPEWIMIDPTRLKQILNNLISNANKFTEDGIIELKVEQIARNNQSLYLQFSLKDTGIGIPEDKLVHIFDEFSQVDSSLQRTTHGTGLGLNIVTNLVHLMSGTIDVKSTLGKGSEFIIDLPLEIGEPQLIIETNNFNKDLLKGKKILICEDIELNRLLAKKVLNQFNCELSFAENGKIGVKMVKTIDPDIVLMDIQMPIMNGYEATTKIREFSTVPIIAMTAHMLDQEKEKCDSLGMNGFIPKPFKEKDVITLLGEVLEKNNKRKLINLNKWELLNMPTLVNLASEDEEFVVEIFDMYITTAEERVLKYNNALLNNDLEEEAQIAHILRSSFSTFDLNELRDLSVKIEKRLANMYEREHFIKLINNSIQLIKEKKKLFKS